MSNVRNLLSMSVVLVRFVYTIAAIRWRSPWRVESSSSTEQGFQLLLWWGATDQVEPQNKFVFILLDRLVVLSCGRVDVQSSYWCLDGEYFSLKISRWCVDGRTKRACANEVHHKSSPATPRAAGLCSFSAQYCDFRFSSKAYIWKYTVCIRGKEIYLISLSQQLG